MAEKHRQKLAAMTPEELAEFRRKAIERTRSIPIEVRRERAARSYGYRKVYLSTKEGREKCLEDRRVRLWWGGLLDQLRTRIKKRKSGPLEKSPEINSQWLKDQFTRQNGRCYYTGIPFEIERVRRGMRRPSLDRLDSNKGYTPDNCVLCLTAINYMKNDYDLDAFYALLGDIRSHSPTVR
jgi:hypothetical protein